MEAITLLHTEAGLTPETESLLSNAGVDITKIATNRNRIVTHVDKIFSIVSDYEQSKELIAGIVKNLELNLEYIEKNREDFEKDGLDEIHMNALRQQLNITLNRVMKTGPQSDVEQIVSLFSQEDFLKKAVRLILKHIECSIILFYLALLTAPHAEKARYPVPDQRFDPLDYYTPDRPIIAALPELHIYTGIALERLDHLYDHIETMAARKTGEIATPIHAPCVALPVHPEDHP